MPLNFENGRFRSLRSETASGPSHFVKWYTSHADEWLSERLAQWASRTCVEPRGLKIRGSRPPLGSCGMFRTLDFHWATILLPPPHERANLREPR